MNKFDQLRLQVRSLQARVDSLEAAAAADRTAARVSVLPDRRAMSPPRARSCGRGSSYCTRNSGAVG